MGLNRSLPGRNPGAVIVAVALMALITIAGVLWARHRAQMRALADAGNDPIKLIQAAEQGRISPAQRDAAIASSVQLHLSQRLDAYFSLPVGKARQDYLDKLIDEQEQLRHKLQRLQTDQASAAVEPKDSPGVQVKMEPAPLSNDLGQAKRVMIRKTGEGGELPPELRAKAAEFAAAIARRRAERGLPPGPDGKMGIVVIKHDEPTAPASSR